MANRYFNIPRCTSVTVYRTLNFSTLVTSAIALRKRYRPFSTRRTLLGFVMATRKAAQQVQRSILDRPKFGQNVDKLTRGRPIQSSETDRRPRSTQASPNAKLPGRKLSHSSSASSVNPKRNVRKRSTSPSKAIDLSKSFQRLSVREQKKPITSVRRFTSSSGGSCKSLEDVARWILKGRSKNIVVMAGAGISTSSGIPDFRTPGSGLYDNLQQYKIPYPEAIFDLIYFHNNPRPFFTLAKELYPGNYRPNYVHYFVRMLHERGKLLRMYTQNIDGLERLAGIPPEKLVEAHGTFSTASCIRCKQSHSGDDIKETIMSDEIPKCTRPRCTGVVKPDIVFFGEDLPKRFFYYLKDLPQCDMLIIMGTSLEVYPFAGIVNSARGYIPRVLINREAVGPFAGTKPARFNDLAVTGDLVESVQKFARVLGWKKAMDDLIAENEALLDEKFSSPQNPVANDKSDSCPENSKSTDMKTDLNKNSAKTENPANSGIRSTNAAQDRAVGKPGSRSLHTQSAASVKKNKVSLPNISKPINKKNTWRRYVVSSSSSESSSSSSEDSDSSSDG